MQDKALYIVLIDIIGSHSPVIVFLHTVVSPNDDCPL